MEGRRIRSEAEGSKKNSPTKKHECSRSRKRVKARENIGERDGVRETRTEERAETLLAGELEDRATESEQGGAREKGRKAGEKRERKERVNCRTTFSR